MDTEKTIDFLDSIGSEIGEVDPEDDYFEFECGKGHIHYMYGHAIRKILKSRIRNEINPSCIYERS
jgi:hypothetical protein